MSFAKIQDTIAALHPEVAVGGFTAYDGTVEFYGRVKALARPDMRVLDFGAGRGAWFEDEDSVYRRGTRLLRGSVAELIGCDVDQAVLQNQAIDRAIVLTPGQPLPLANESIDMVVSDYVFEHVVDPGALAAELNRVLKKGGWICARTPTKYNYVTFASRLISNLKHAAWLRKVQPGRKSEDVFPTAYRLNSRRDVGKVFPETAFDNHTYLYCFEPQYHFGKVFVYRAFQFLHWLLPASMSGNLYIFLRKR